MTLSPIPRGEAVPEGFTLPHNTTRTMADVWADDAKHEAAVAAAKASGSRGGMRANLRFGGKKAKQRFAGYDPTEVQVRKIAGGKE